MVIKNKNIISTSIVVFIALIFVWIFIVNLFPKGYIVSAADDAFFFDMKNSARSYFYTWSNVLGNGSGQESQVQASLLYQLILVLFSFLKLSNNIVQTLSIPIFTFLSSVSFLIALRIQFSEEKKNTVMQVFFSLLYGLNGYTLYLFMHVFGYFYQQIFYLFIPVIFVLAYKIIEGSFSKKHIIGFIAVSFLCSVAFNNPGFLVAFSIVLLFMLLFFILSDFRKSLFYIKQCMYVIGILVITNLFWLLPYSVSVIEKTSVLTSSLSGWDIVSWLKWQSTHIIDIFRFMPINSDGKFPNNFMYPPVLKILFSFISFLPIILILFGLLWKQEKYNKRELFYFSFFVFLILAIAKFYGPLATLSIKFFSLPIINATRSYDKFMVFLPFVVLMLIYICFISSEKIKRKVKWTVIVVLLAYPLPFYTGKLQQNISIAFDQSKNYLTAAYSYLVKVPEDYFEASHIVNTASPYEFKVQYLPYSAINSPGWSQYPKWKFIGNDVTRRLFLKPVQTPATFLNIGKFNYGETFNTYAHPEWILRLLGLMNDSYLVFNKDVDEQFLKVSNDKIAYLENEKKIKPIFKKEHINLYTIDDTYFLPLFYVPKDIIYADIDYTQYPDLLSIENFSPRSLYVLGNEQMNKTFFDRYIETSQDTTGDSTTSISIHRASFPVSAKETVGEKSDSTSISVTQERSSLKIPGLIAFHKVNPVKYVITVSHAQKDFPLVFSETYDAKWKLYALPQGNKIAPTQAFPNQQDRFSIAADDKQKLKDKGLLANDGPRYISKDIKGTIQNDNIPPGHFFDTYFPSKKIYEIPKQNHFMANGYSNGWIINTHDVCEKSIICTQNKDGTYDFELVIEYFPQRLFYLGLLITGGILLGGFGYLGCNYWFKRRNRKNLLLLSVNE